MKNWWKNASREERSDMVKVALKSSAKGAVIGLLICSVVILIFMGIIAPRIIESRKEAEALRQSREALSSLAEESFQETEIVAYIPRSKEIIVFHTDKNMFETTRNGEDYSEFGRLLQEANGEWDYYIYNGTTKTFSMHGSKTDTYEEIRSLAFESLSEANRTQ